CWYLPSARPESPGTDLPRAAPLGAAGERVGSARRWLSVPTRHVGHEWDQLIWGRYLLSVKAIGWWKLRASQGGTLKPLTVAEKGTSLRLPLYLGQEGPCLPLP